MSYKKPSCLSRVYCICFASAETSLGLAGATTLPGVPGVFKVPSKGLVQVSALEDALGGNSKASEPLSQPLRVLTAEQPNSFVSSTISTQ